jgi:rhodanese-related sulfurtransferase
MAPSPDISPAALLRRIGSPDLPALVDLTLEADFAEDPQLIPGAFRHSHEDPAGLMGLLDPGAPVVLICQKGGKLSQGMAALLRARGFSASCLTGGNRAWAAVPGAPRLSVSALPPLRPEGSRWVMAEEAPVAGLACAWLVRRFLDRRAEMLFVPAVTVTEVAERFAARPLDLSGDDPLGQLCREVGLEMAALAELSHQLRDAPLAPLWRGLERRHPEALPRLAEALPIFDALFEGLRDGEAAA